MSNRKLREFREKLWRIDPHCEKCGVVTILPQNVDGAYTDEHGLLIIKKVPHNMATIQHIYNRMNPLRRTPLKPNERRLLLWCYRCNTEYNELYEKPR